MLRANLEAMRRRWLALGLGLGSALLALPGRANADDAPVKVRVEYEAPQDCPDETAFWKALRERTPRVEPVTDETATVVRVTVGRDTARGGHWGSLLLVEDGVVTGRRRVDGASCAEVVEALGLAAALSLDPEAMLGPPPEPKPAPRTEQRPPAEASEPALPSESTAREPRHRLAIGSHGVLEVPLVPFVFGGAEVFLDVERRPRGPVLGLSLGYAVAHNSIAGFGLGKGTFAGCPTRVPLGGDSAFLPCATFDVGWVRGAGRNMLIEEQATRSWLAVGLQARFRVGLSQHIFLDVSGALSAPLVDRAFVTGTPPETVAESPAISPGGKIGIGLRP
jgi:hypothetical protein